MLDPFQVIVFERAANVHCQTVGAHKLAKFGDVLAGYGLEIVGNLNGDL
jgi:hypothetical protein